MGRVDATEVRDLLQNSHLASVILPNVFDIKTNKAIIDEFVHSQSRRLKTPDKAEFRHLTPDLTRLMGVTASARAAKV